MHLQRSVAASDGTEQGQEMSSHGALEIGLTADFLLHHLRQCPFPSRRATHANLHSVASPAPAQEFVTVK